MSIVRIRQVVYEVVAEMAEVAVSDIRDNLTLCQSLGFGLTLGQAEFLELRYRLEKELGLGIPEHLVPPEDKLDSITVGDLIILFAGLLPIPA